MREEIKIGDHVYMVENQIVKAIKSPAEPSGLSHAIYQIGKNINEVKKEYQER